MTTATDIKFKDAQAYLAKHQGDSYLQGWAFLWDKGDYLPWDRGFPNPALEDTLVQRVGTIGGPIGPDGERRKALVPGCGRGVDVLLFASFGYDAYGLECSAAAVEACKKEEEKVNDSQYRVRDEKVGKGKITFVQGDFFDDTWLKEIGVPRNGFDVIYDYTVCIGRPFCHCYCFLSPLVLCVLQTEPQDGSLFLVFLDFPSNNYLVFLCSKPRAPS